MAETTHVTDNNFIVIQGWMITQLGLKGNELIVYAAIYGFSQATGQVYSGSQQYLADWANSTKRNVIKVLNTLIEKGYIQKTEKYVNNVKFCDYLAVTPEDMKNTNDTIGEKSSSGEKNDGVPDTPVVKKVHGGGEQSSPHNIADNIYNTPYNPPSTSSHGDYSPAEKSAGDPPPSEKPCTKNPDVVTMFSTLSSGTVMRDKPCTENPDAVTAEPVTKKKPQKHRYGRYNNVLLTDEEYSTLQSEFPSDYSDRIERLSEYIESKGEKYKSHLATIRNWARRDKEKGGWQSTGQAVRQDGNPVFDFLMQEAKKT